MIDRLASRGREPVEERLARECAKLDAKCLAEDLEVY